ncbi:conserved hypothetical protein [Desulfonatronospira thiodismutans ASO3-1]|uniref:Uncharacterized protein n=1 Tax=Desulfonatronospira thiodismutans ASO3-1 TaxID=555779 RepID=D6SN31_9BACT|nr:hypothetical protein [Desulfonatronospira thiodismutans]EFI36092.1 conserved hypothetical protein [Desulfonatronospira thiodismutans ASO3-1]
MLQAINQGKSNFYKRYVGHREKGERVSEEDELTSLILGPLELIPGHLSAIFWGTLLSEFKIPSVPSNFPEKAEIAFWKSRKNFMTGKPIEPDIVVDLKWPSGESFLLLIEMKWHSPLSGKDQLQIQWTEFLSEEERSKALHLFIAPETSEASKARRARDVWSGRLLAISWFDILCILQDKIRKRDPVYEPLMPWMTQVVALLDKLGIRPFRGFKNLKLPEYSISKESKHLFWNGFIGFTYLAQPALITTNDQIFFNNKE